MKWELINETKNNRIYKQDKTGTELETMVIYTDMFGNDWWGFKDLFKVPYQRLAFSKQVVDFFATGVTPDDLDKWDEEEKALLKSSDPEKYEKIYAIVLERQKMRKSLVDPMVQHLSLATIYALFPDERIDYFDMATISRKMELWKPDQEAVSFFLSWHIDHIASYISSLNSISQTVLKHRS